MRNSFKLTWNERHVLHALESDAGESCAALGRTLRLSKETTRNVVNSLEQKGIIAGYYPTVNLSLLGICLFHVFVRVPLSGPRARDAAISSLSASAEVYWISRTGGKFDLVFGVEAHDPVHFDAIFTEIQKRCRQHFKWVEIHSVISSTAFPRNYLVPGSIKKKTPLPGLGNSKKHAGVPIALSPLQKELLQHLQSTRRLSLTELSASLKQTRGVVRSQISRLKKTGILTGYRAKVRAERFGYQVYRLLLSVNQLDGTVVKKFHDYGAAHPNIVHLDYTLGRWNFQYTCEVLNPQELETLLSELQEHMHPLIDDIDILMVFLDSV